MRPNLRRILNQSTPSFISPALVPRDHPIPKNQLPHPIRYTRRPYPFHHLSSTYTQFSFSYNVLLLRSSRASIQRRTYVMDSKKDPNRSERALMDELHRLSHRQENAQPALGPFMMPRGKVDEKPLSAEEFHHWSRVGWTERLRRVIRMGRNLIIVSFGSSLALLVIYSITSELLAPSSATNLMNMTIKTLEESDELRKILKYPIKFHTTPIQSAAGNPIATNRTAGIPQSLNHHNGAVELRFWVESYKPNQIEGDWRSLSWWKAWIGPLITSDVYHHQYGSPTDRRSSELNPNPKDNHQQSPQKSNSDHSTGWWPGLLQSIMPNTFGRSQSAGNSSGNQKSSWSQRFFQSHDNFEHGEVTAELIKESDGQWKYKSLIIDFPDSQNVTYRLNLFKELKRKQKQWMNPWTGQKEHEKIDASDNHSNQTTRYRFWSRQITN